MIPSSLFFTLLPIFPSPITRAFLFSNPSLGDFFQGGLISGSGNNILMIKETVKLAASSNKKFFVFSEGSSTDIFLDLHSSNGILSMPTPALNIPLSFSKSLRLIGLLPSRTISASALRLVNSIPSLNSSMIEVFFQTLILFIRLMHFV